MHQIISDNYSRAFDACIQLHRVEQDRIAGYLESGMYGWITDGRPTKHVPHISSSELHDRINNRKKNDPAGHKSCL